MLLIFRVDWWALLVEYICDLDWRYSRCVEDYRKEDGMDAPGFASQIRAYRQNLCQMRKSNDPFGLRVFDEKMQITRMLTGSSQCDLRLLIPDAGIGQNGFHDVVIENLLGTSTWRSIYVSPADVIGLRRRWPQAVFHVMRERCVEIEDLRHKAYTGDQPAYRYTGRGYCRCAG